MLRRIKRSTVLVDNHVDAVGSGFGFARRREGFFVLTSGSIARPGLSQGVSVVFDAGTKEERRYMGELVAGGAPHHDISLVRISGVPMDRDVLDLAPAEDVGAYETRPILIPGYPKANEPSQVLPTVTLSHGRISSLRFGRLGELDAIQVDARLRAGNLGSPVIDDTGHVIGVVTGGLEATDISLATPGSSIHRLLNGVVTDVTVRAEPLRLRLRDLVRFRGSRTRIEAMFKLSDPFSRVTRVVLRALPMGTAPPLEALEPPYAPIGAEWVWRSVEGPAALLEVELNGVDGGVLWIQPSYETPAGPIVLEPLEVRLSKDSAAQEIRRASVARRRARPRQPEPRAPALPPTVVKERGDWLGLPPDEAAAVLVSSPPLDNRRQQDFGGTAGEIRTASRRDRVSSVASRPLSGIHLGITPTRGIGRKLELEKPQSPELVEANVLFTTHDNPVAEIVWWNDGKSFFLLRKDGLLRRIALPDLREEVRLELDAPTSSMSMSKEGLLILLPSLQEIVIVDPVTLRPRGAIASPGATKIISSPGCPLAFYAGDSHGLRVIDLEARENVLRVTSLAVEGERLGSLSDFYPLRVAPQGHFLITHGHRIDLTERRLKPRGPIPTRNPLAISPDGRYVAAYGRSKTRAGFDERQLYVVKSNFPGAPVLTIDVSAKAAAFDLHHRQLWVLDSGRILKIFDAEGQLKRQIPLRNQEGFLQMTVSPAGLGAWLVLQESAFWFPEAPGPLE